MNVLRMLPAAKKLIFWIAALIVIKIRIAHIGGELSQASVPPWLTNLVNGWLTDGLTWLDCLEMIGMLMAAIALAMAQFAWFHTGEAIYAIWLAHDLRQVWDKRPWRRAQCTPPAPQAAEASAGKKHRRGKHKRKGKKRRR